MLLSRMLQENILLLKQFFLKIGMIIWHLTEKKM